MKMKIRIQLTFIIILFIESINAQVPQAIPYQAVARDNAGSLIANQTVSLRFSIHDATAAGTIVYKETQSKTTNSQGLFTANIGQGTVVSGNFSTIDWSGNLKFMQVELDAAGGTNYIDMGTQQMLSVPYALNAGNVNWTKTGNNISNSNSGNVGIGTSTPSSSAILDASSTSKGFLLPRMTVAQRNLITNPSAGLQIWCIDCHQLQIFDGTSWQSIANYTTAALPNVTICSQVWMTKNLDVDKYRNGDPIPKVTDPAQWAALTTGAYCYYNNDSTNYASTYGKLYNWYAVNDPRGFSPSGWHIPSDAEWNTLETCLGGINVAGGKMKEAGTVHWGNGNSGTNSSGFTGLPAGTRYYLGTFFNVLHFGYFWSSNEYNAVLAPLRFLSDVNSALGLNYFEKQDAFSVRCIKD